MAYRVRAVKVSTTALGNKRNSEGEADDDEGTGKEGLDSLMDLEPSSGRVPEVSRDQSTQRQKKQEGNHTNDAMSDNHPVRPGQR